jgi:archaellum component FlaC
MNRSRIREGAAISLFPFLAVLLCTMGALLVLLVLFGYSAKQQDKQAARDQAQQQSAELRLAADNLRWRLEQLNAMRQKTGADLEALRLQLAGIEEHSRDLADELKELQQLDARLAADADSVVPDADELARLEEELKSARESLDDARRERDSRPPAYAVVPYDGQSGTHRRPLFIECSLDGVFLQPEGIRLNPADFEGPSGPGNPLASALRAAREYLARQAIRKDDPALRPYPLLLVRPSGVMAYYAAREAIASWGSDFGYQLIDEDWTIAFPERDLALKDVEMQAINEARERLAWLAQTRSAVRRAKPVGQQYRASAVRGGVVADGGPTVLGDQSRWDWANQQSARGGVGVGAGRGAVSGAGGGAGREAGQAGGDASLAGRPLKAGAASGGFGQVTSEQAGSGRGGSGQAGQIGFGQNGFGQSEGLPANAHAMEGGTGEGAFVGLHSGAASGVSGSGDGINQSGAVAAAGPQGFSGSSAEGAGVTNQHPAGSSLGRHRTGDQSAGQGAVDSEAGGPGTRGTAAVGTNGSGGGGEESANATAAAGGGTPGGPQIPLSLSVGGQQAGGSSGQTGIESAEASGGAGQGCDSLAGVRGSDWASFATSQRYIPLTRPIQLECASDELRLLDEAGRRVVVRIPVFERTVDSVDSLVAAIRRRVDSWGIAGDRLYWKPELILSETPDGAGRVSDLQQLLAGSGLGTRLKRQSDAVERLPAVQGLRRQASQRNALGETAEVRQ